MSELSENISENRKCGRPLVLPPTFRKTYEGLWNEIKSPMGFGTNTINLVPTPCWSMSLEWLIDAAVLNQGQPGSYRQTILQALGRISHEKDLKTVARRICEQRPTTRQALATIRHLRRGQLPTGDVDQITEVLRRTLNAYLSEHASMNREDVLQALAILRLAVQATAEDTTITKRSGVPQCVSPAPGLAE